MSTLQFTLSQLTTEKLLEVTHIYPDLNPDEIVRKSFEDTKKLSEIYGIYLEMADTSVPRDALLDLIEKQLAEDCQESRESTPKVNKDE